MKTISRDIYNAVEAFDKKLYFREDIEKAIDDLENAHDENIHTKRANLNIMLKAYGINCDEKMQAPAYRKILQNSDIPSIITLPEFCWGEMVNLYKAYSSPGEYIKRIVTQYGAPEYNVPGSSIRLRILKQFLGKLNYLKGTRFYSKKLEKTVMEDYKGVIESIGEEVFDYKFGSDVYPYVELEALIVAYGDVLYQIDEEDEYLYELVRKFDETFKDKKAAKLLEFIYENNHRDREKKISYYIINKKSPELVKEILSYLLAKKATLDKELDEAYYSKKDRFYQCERIENELKKRYVKCKFLTEDFVLFVSNTLEVYIEKDVSKEEIFRIIEKNTVNRPRILSRINKCLVSAIKKHMKERNKIFKKIKDNGKIKVGSKPVELLQICTDLENGKFNSYAEMKEILYMFAFAFNMTIYIGENDEYDIYKDIKCQLFENYYCDNIIRYLDNSSPTATQDEPNGVMIQYNNFVEIVYLYWLNKEKDSTYKQDEPYEWYKFNNAIRMISEIVDRYEIAEQIACDSQTKTSEKVEKALEITKKKDKDTQVYKNYLFGVDDDVTVYSKEPKLKVGELLSKTEEKFIEFILDNYDIDLEKQYVGEKSYEGFENQLLQRSACEEYAKYIDSIEKLIDLKEGLGSDMLDFDLEFFKEIYDETQSDVAISKEDYERFLKIFHKLKKVVKTFPQTMNKGQMSRTKLMLAHYYDFILCHQSDDSCNENFIDFYNEYCSELEYALEISSYQGVSSKNLFDMLLIYSAFMLIRQIF